MDGRVPTLSGTVIFTRDVDTRTQRGLRRLESPEPPWAHQAGAGPAPRALRLQTPGLHSPVRRARQTRPPRNHWVADFHDNRGAVRTRRTGRRQASRRRLRGAPGPPAHLPAPPSSVLRAARPRPTAAAPPPRRQVAGSGPAPGAGPPAPARSAQPGQPRAAARSPCASAAPRPRGPAPARPSRACAPPGPPARRTPESCSWVPARPHRSAGAGPPAGVFDLCTPLRLWRPRRVPKEGGSVGEPCARWVRAALGVQVHAVPARRLETQHAQPRNTRN